MDNRHIAVMVGSLRRDSVNRRLAEGVVRLAPPGFTFSFLQIGTLPLYNADDEGSGHAAVRQLRGDIEAAQGLMFVTPEYNRSIPGVLKNAIDHASRPSAPSGRPALRGRPAGILGASPGAVGTALAQQHLRNILAHLDMPTMGQPEAFIHVRDGFFDGAGNIGEGSREFLRGWMQAFAAWVGRHAPVS